MHKNTQSLLMTGLVALGALWGAAACAAAPYANATVEGALAPGVYGRIQIGNAPPPPVIYAQPVIIQRAPVYVQQPPLYLHVPPGHAKKWSKHCARYNACNRPVYFVKVRGDDDFERRRGQDNHHGYENEQGNRHDNDHNDHDRGHDGGHDRGHDRGHGKGHDKG